MSDRRISDRIEESLRAANLQPEGSAKETIRAAVFAKATFLRNLLDDGACPIKIAEIFSAEFDRAIKPSTILAYVRAATKDRKGGGGSGRGGSARLRSPKTPNPPPPRGPARLPHAPPVRATAATTEVPDQFNDMLIERRDPAHYSPPDLLEYDQMIALPSATPLAPR
ncbi:hypothetical protein AB6806_04700 [Bosea sp. RCC_152_1]|uniref:hypothetical protein n=1 Tax=Bosea sp. RCC_152_1 TaxID=3239228 RepID=UPI0035235493